MNYDVVGVHVTGYGANFVGRPAKLHEETNPIDWTATLLLGYVRKIESIARYERAARRRFEQTTADVDSETTAQSSSSDVAATQPVDGCDGGVENSTRLDDSPPLLRARSEVQTGAKIN
ncbi:hypothetical protein MRX96_030848 [Rhipicephalus microplus]